MFLDDTEAKITCLLNDTLVDFVRHSCSVLNLILYDDTDTFVFFPHALMPDLVHQSFPHYHREVVVNDYLL